MQHLSSDQVKQCIGTFFASNLVRISQVSGLQNEKKAQNEQIATDREQFPAVCRDKTLWLFGKGQGLYRLIAAVARLTASSEKFAFHALSLLSASHCICCCRSRHAGARAVSDLQAIVLLFREISLRWLCRETLRTQLGTQPYAAGRPVLPISPKVVSGILAFLAGCELSESREKNIKV
jgi:hypothetical protein